MLCILVVCATQSMFLRTIYYYRYLRIKIICPWTWLYGTAPYRYRYLTKKKISKFAYIYLVEQLKARRLLLLDQSGGPGSGGSVSAAAAGGLLLASPAAEDAWQLLLQHPEQADPATGGPTHAILIAMECLALLNRLPDAVEALNTELQAQLFQIMTRTTLQIIG
jgi:hypothetical protein